MSSIKDIPREKVPWYPTILDEKCTGCGACVKFCAHDVYDLPGKARVKNPFNCIIGCSGCQSECPEGALSFPSLLDIRDILKALREEHQGKA